MQQSVEQFSFTSSESTQNLCLISQITAFLNRIKKPPIGGFLFSETIN
ncbi:hypothetical protein PAUR_a4459 [Pseudoalteromonas aurantia 208]|uniref:Orphan protein n=1 Tax=Pseudoalteromonas aurantia 208 TaxID=1314867 RepID=A0ABR9EFX2_9GAMM|nr:hypothetical protein [Pseudoalteromonas aurantia 208]